MNKDLPLFRCSWLEVYFGLFGPCLTYHTSGYDADNARLVISLIFCQLYIALPWKHNTKHNYDMYATYGFYSAAEPDRMIFQWGNTYKMLIMPWVRTVVRRNLLDINGDIVVLDDDSYDSISKEIDELPSNYIKSRHCYGHDCQYYIVRRITRAKIFKNLNWFDKIEYEFNVTFDKPFYGSTMLIFSSSTNLAEAEQIELQMMLKDETYKNF